MISEGRELRGSRTIVRPLDRKLAIRNGGCLNGYKKTRMRLQNLFYLVKQLGMMIVFRNIVWHRMHKILYKNKNVLTQL